MHREHRHHPLVAGLAVIGGISLILASFALGPIATVVTATGVMVGLLAAGVLVLGATRRTPVLVPVRKAKRRR